MFFLVWVETMCVGFFEFLGSVFLCKVKWSIRFTWTLSELNQSEWKYSSLFYFQICAFICFALNKLKDWIWRRNTSHNNPFMIIGREPSLNHKPTGASFTSVSSKQFRPKCVNGAASWTTWTKNHVATRIHILQHAAAQNHFCNLKGSQSEHLAAQKWAPLSGWRCGSWHNAAWNFGPHQSKQTKKYTQFLLNWALFKKMRFIISINWPVKTVKQWNKYLFASDWLSQNEFEPKCWNRSIGCFVDHMTRVQQLVRFFWLEQMSKMVKQHTATQQCSQKCAPKQFHSILFYSILFICALDKNCLWVFVAHLYVGRFRFVLSLHCLVSVEHTLNSNLNCLHCNVCLQFWHWEQTCLHKFWPIAHQKHPPKLTRHNRHGYNCHVSRPLVFLVQVAFAIMWLL